MAIVNGFYTFFESTVIITIHSPANILMTDESTGFRVGFDSVSNSFVVEIFGANYTGPGTEPQVITIPGAVPGKFKLQLFGTGTGTYKVDEELFTATGEKISSVSYNGSIVPGQIKVGIINISGTELQSEGMVAGKGDCNDDSKVDIVDALFIAQSTVGLRNFNPGQYAAADVSGDARVDIVDALFIAQSTVGLRIL